MKLTTKHGTYAKRIKPLVLFMFEYFDVFEEATKEMVSNLASTVRYFRANKVYIIESTNKLEVETRQTDYCCNVMLETYLQDGAVCCNDLITLLFPSLKEVLEQEMVMSNDKNTYREKYSDYLK